MIEKLVDKIRDKINSPRKQYQLLANKVTWNKLCASMDTIEDNEVAIDYYKKLPPFNGFSGGYLYIYGLLQALFLQQDAVNHLSQSLFNEKIDYKNDFPKIYKIRELRNNAIGHPTSRWNDEAFCVISRISIQKDKFTICHYLPKQRSKFEEINIEQILSTQAKLIAKILKRILNELVMEEKNHKNKFESKTLMEIIPGSMNDNISKLYEGIYSLDSGKLLFAKIELEILMKILTDVKVGIEERFGNINAVDEAQRIFAKLDFIFNHLSVLLDNNQYAQNLDSEVYIDSLKKEIGSLKEILVEIDDDFSKSV